jgi:hypothetical protein
MPITPAVTELSLGAWLVKAAPGRAPIDEWVESDFAAVTTRCVRPTYRARMIRAGQPVLLWLSGGDVRLPSGIYAQGRTTGAVRVEDEDGPVMPLVLRGIDPVVPRTDLLALPGLRDLEVLRMPAGGNPSFVPHDAYAQLRASFPQVGPA